jgi:hypothetical protein
MDLELGEWFRDSVVLVPLLIRVTTQDSFVKHKSLAETPPRFYKLARNIGVVRWADFSGKRTSPDYTIPSERSIPSLDCKNPPLPKCGHS